MGILDNVLKLFVGDKSKKDISEIQPMVALIKNQEAEIASLTIDELRSKTVEFKNKIKADQKEIQDQIKATLARLSGAGKSSKFAQRTKMRRNKRDDNAANAEAAALEQELQSKILKVTEFVTANELAKMMDVPVTQVISTCMSLGMFVSINQRLDAETLTIVADEFGFETEFV